MPWVVTATIYFRHCDGLCAINFNSLYPMNIHGHYRKFSVPSWNSVLYIISLDPLALPFYNVICVPNAFPESYGRSNRSLVHQVNLILYRRITLGLWRKVLQRSKKSFVGTVELSGPGPIQPENCSCQRPQCIMQSAGDRNSTSHTGLLRCLICSATA